MNAILSEPTWVQPEFYPFENNFIDLPAGRMHYVDEGQGEVLLFVHGTPTWSFLYRDLIKPLSKSYRCIAIDHIGFGLSEKSNTFSGTAPGAFRKPSCFYGGIGSAGYYTGGARFWRPDRIRSGASDP